MTSNYTVHVCSSLTIWLNEDLAYKKFSSLISIKSPLECSKTLDSPLENKSTHAAIHGNQCIISDDFTALPCLRAMLENTWISVVEQSR